MRPNAHPERIHRVYLVGSHATGKTTLARWIRDRYGIPMIAEVARGVLAEMEERLDSLRADVDLVNRYQAQVFVRQIEAEARVGGSFVSDRAFCNLAYAAHHSTILAQVFRDQRLRAYMESVREGIVFFLRPHQALVQADGVRAGLELGRGRAHRRHGQADARDVRRAVHPARVAVDAGARALRRARAVARGAHGAHRSRRVCPAHGSTTVLVGDGDDVRVGRVN